MFNLGSDGWLCDLDHGHLLVNGSSSAGRDQFDSGRLFPAVRHHEHHLGDDGLHEEDQHDVPRRLDGGPIHRVLQFT